MENPWKDVKSGAGQDLEIVYEFGPFRLIPSEGRLYRDGAVVQLTPKVLKILEVLVERNGRLVEKDCLMAIVWPDTHVEEGNLTANISVLRKALGESRKESQFIETVPTRGYRFIAPVKVSTKSPIGATQSLAQHFGKNNNGFHTSDHSVEPSDPGFELSAESKSQPTLRPRRKFLIAAVSSFIFALFALFYWFYRRFSQDPVPTPTPRPKIRSIAVLPFQTAGMSTGDEHLGPGLADALITGLSRYNGLLVRPSSASRNLQSLGSDPLQAGRELKVDMAVAGTIQREGEDLRVTMRLIQVSDGEILWTGKFSGKTNKVFNLQDALSRNLAQALIRKYPGEITLAQQFGRNYAPKEEAHDAYLKGRYHIYKYTLADWRKSVDYLTEATNIEPGYALAYASLAEAYTIAAELYLPPNEARPKAQEAAERAVSLDENLSEAYTSLAAVKAYYHWDWTGAAQEFERAMTFNPQLATAHNWYGWHLLWQGRYDESLKHLREAQKIEPNSCFIWADIGTYFYCLRQYEQAEAEMKKLLEVEPECFSAHAVLGWVYLKQNRFAEAVATFEKTREMGDSPAAIAALAHARARASDRAGAERLLAELRRRPNGEYNSPFNYVLVYLGLGDRERTFDWLERSYQAHSAFLLTLKVDPIFDPIRDDPRFANLLRRLNLTPPSQSNGREMRR